jgi:hypothetical protein
MHRLRASGNHLLARCHQMLTKLKTPQHQSLASKRLGSSNESSWLLNKGSRQEEELPREMSPRHALPEIRSAQELLAQIAVRILNRKGRKADE